MSERLTTLEAKVRWSGGAWGADSEWGWRDMRHMLDVTRKCPFPMSPASLGRLVSGTENF